jgi:hypothetical protein
VEKKTYDQLLDEHGLSDTGAAEQTNLTATSVGCKKIYDFDTSDEHFSSGGLVDECWSIGVDWKFLGTFDRTSLIDWVAGDIHDTAKCARSNGNHDWGASVDGRVATD